MTKQTETKKRTQVKDLPGSNKKLTARELQKVKGGSPRDQATGQAVAVIGPCDRKYK